MSLGKSQPPELGDRTDNKYDRVIGADLVSLIPILGPVIQIVLNETIPNIRLERIEDYLKFLQNRINELELESALGGSEGLDMFEEGLWQSARAISDKRKKYIGELVAHGLTAVDNDQLLARHFLKFLNILDDRQIVLLAKYHPSNAPYVGNKKAISFHETHKDVIHPELAIEDMFDDNGRKIAEPVMLLNASLVGHLASIGLLEERNSIDSVGQPLHIKQFHITQMGIKFLEYVGILK